MMRMPGSITHLSKRPCVFLHVAPLVWTRSQVLMEGISIVLRYKFICHGIASIFPFFAISGPQTPFTHPLLFRVFYVCFIPFSLPPI